jgi:hypothetical protein
MIIPIPFTEEPETRQGFPCKAFRKVIEIRFDSIALLHQYHIDGKWKSSHTDVRSICLMKIKNWTLGYKEDHFWYDGTHCIYTIGPIGIQWDDYNCKKCHPDD